MFDRETMHQNQYAKMQEIFFIRCSYIMFMQMNNLINLFIHIPKSETMYSQFVGAQKLYAGGIQ